MKQNYENKSTTKRMDTKKTLSCIQTNNNLILTNKMNAEGCWFAISYAFILELLK